MEGYGLGLELGPADLIAPLCPAPAWLPLPATLARPTGCSALSPDIWDTAAGPAYSDLQLVNAPSIIDNRFK